jgi:hypothetical protein
MTDRQAGCGTGLAMVAGLGLTQNRRELCIINCASSEIVHQSSGWELHGAPLPAGKKRLLVLEAHENDVMIEAMGRIGVPAANGGGRTTGRPRSRCQVWCKFHHRF